MARAGYTDNCCQLVRLEVLPCPRKERGEEKKKNNIDSPRGSHSARSRATAMGRIRGLITKDHQYLICAHVALGHNSTIPHTTSVLVDFSSVDERHDVQETLVVISINYIEDIEDYRRRFL